MVAQSQYHADERSPLLDRTTADSRSDRDYDSVTTLDTQEPLSPISSPNIDYKPPNKISNADLCWVLAGLWSAVFLGALDG